MRERLHQRREHEEDIALIRRLIKAGNSQSTRLKNAAQEESGMGWRRLKAIMHRHEGHEWRKERAFGGNNANMYTSCWAHKSRGIEPPSEKGTTEITKIHQG
jgi:hypothetical protein